MLERRRSRPTQDGARIGVRSGRDRDDRPLIDSTPWRTPVRFSPGRLRGVIAVPGDKSISHRALVVAAALDRPVAISNLNAGRDVAATSAAVEALGARLERLENGSVAVCGGRLHAPGAVLDCANSGSTARMMLGVCAGANLMAGFDGDASLRARPMEPVAGQLRAFGAKIETEDGRLPMTIRGTPRIETRDFILLSASAQVKTALLFASLFARTPVTISGDRHSRDHSERLLQFLGADVTWDGRRVALRRFDLIPRAIQVAGDVSAAAFLSRPRRLRREVTFRSRRAA